MHNAVKRGVILRLDTYLVCYSMDLARSEECRAFCHSRTGSARAVRRGQPGGLSAACRGARGYCGRSALSESLSRAGHAAVAAPPTALTLLPRACTLMPVLYVCTRCVHHDVAAAFSCPAATCVHAAAACCLCVQAAAADLYLLSPLWWLLLPPPLPALITGSTSSVPWILNAFDACDRGP